VGERDAPFRELAAHYERAMPRCRTVVVPDCHHYPMVDQPAAFADALLGFLDGARPHD
jgi:pimeloyl-ACP methyl ester carboxylesterase